MKVEYICCAGLDVHKRTVVVCVLKGALGEQVVSKTKSFGTTTPELMEMIEWLKSCGATHLAMERLAITGCRFTTSWKATSS